MNSHYDIAIVGAGLVGASVALALKNSGLRVLLIDAHAANPKDSRLFALNISSVNFLEQLGVWQLVSEHASAIKQIHVSKRKRFGVLRLSAHDVGLDQLGYMMPARFLEAALLHLLNDASYLDYHRPMSLLSLKEHDQHVQLSVQQGEGIREITAHYVLGADGTQSTVRHCMGFATTEKNYHETAIVTELLAGHDHQNIAYERFYEGGVLAMLPLCNQHLAMILTAPHDNAKDLLALKNDDFVEHIQQLIGNRLGRLQIMKPRASYPLHSLLAKRAASKRVLLLGNAAHTVHPVAAQGFNLALYEVAVLLDCMQDLKSGVMQGLDFTHIEAQFAKQQTMSINASSRISAILQKPTFLSQILLQLGMGILETQGFLKKSFLNALLGRWGNVPRLMAEKVS